MAGVGFGRGLDRGSQADTGTRDASGFVRIQRLWKTNDLVRLRFPMSVQVKTGRDHNANDAPYASVSYGPLLFALPIPDTASANTPDPAAKWKYALDMPGGKPGASVERQPMMARWNWPLEAPLRLRADAVAIDWNPDPKVPGPCPKVP